MSLLHTSAAPHINSGASTNRIMLDVVIAMLPASAAAVVLFGLKALWIILTCVVAAVLSEFVFNLCVHKKQTVGDFSAVVTGLLLALNLPPDLPIWMAAVGGVFAIGVAKQVFGGLGMNPFNPALAARAFMLISFTGPMTTWLKPFWWKTPEAATTATPLAVMKTWFVAEATASATPHGLCNAACKGVPSLCDMLVGNMPGCIGEVSAAALAIGAAYLLWRKVITWHIPVAFIATVFVYSLIAGGAPAMMQVLTGGVMIGACFMATDYVTSPITAKGKLIFGLGWVQRLTSGQSAFMIRIANEQPSG